MAYIKIEKAIAEIDKGDLLVGNNAEWAKEVIRRTPTADVVEVKHGRWQIEDRGGKPTDKPICSQCGATPKYYVNGESSPYCQECGSKMERKVKPYVRQRKKT